MSKIISYLFQQRLTMVMPIWLLLGLALLIALPASAQAQAKTSNVIDLAGFNGGMLGQSIQYFQEQTPLTLAQAKIHFANGQVKQSSSNSISLGIGVNPVWLKFTLRNRQPLPLGYRLSVETPWLDYIDTWLVQGERVVRHVRGGDGIAFEQRPMAYKHYAFEHDFRQGSVDVYMRIEADGPMAIPVGLFPTDKAVQRDISSAYQYGLLYGVMLALALYNLVLYFFIRHKEYGLYCLYLLGFVINSLSYTGQLHTIITGDYGRHFQDWVDIFLMITYSVAGLHFARILLDTKSYAPRLDKFTIRTTIIIPAGMLLGFIFDQLVFSISLAFVLNCGFVTLFVLMGIYALKEEKPYAIIFLISSVTAAICISISTLAVAGFLVPYNDVTFKAIEVGMAFEAILLAMILAQQFRLAKIEKVLAESYARTDMLTQLNNRHGFHQTTVPIWQSIIRKRRDVSIVMIDIDNFKQINDSYGHHEGDNVLKLAARCLSDSARKGDVVARWGGEEFIILLPETSQQQAIQQAERIRMAIANMPVRVQGKSLQITVSVGIAGSEKGLYHDTSLRDTGFAPLINHADKALYQAKTTGKNMTCVAE